MNKALVLLAAALLIAGSAFAQDKEKPSELTTVNSVDLDKYKGKWYEIARYPNRFQKKCVGNTTATYNLKEGGAIEVINECLKQNGKLDVAKGKARIVDEQTNAKLEVRFAPPFLSFLSFVWGDYWIIDLEEDYKYAVVGDPSREYLWILSRTPELETSVYQDILRRVEQKGFEPRKLIETPQNVEVIKGQVVTVPMTENP